MQQRGQTSFDVLEMDWEVGEGKSEGKHHML